jgi:ribose transport system substrate-binding protein
MPYAVFAAVMVLGLIACGGGDDSTDSGSGDGSKADTKATICFFSHSSANTWFQATYEGAQAAAKEAGNTEIVQKDGKFDPAVQASLMQDALASKECNAWMVGQLGPPGYRYAEQAIEQGIKVCGMLVPLGPDAASAELQLDGMTCATYRNPAAIATDIASVIKLACKGVDPCKVGYIKGSNTIPGDVALVKQLHEDLKTDSNIEIVSEQVGQYLADPAYKVTQDMLQANPDLNVIASSGDQMTLGAERAVKAAGKTGQVKLIGSYGSELGLEGVKAKRWFGDTVSLPYSEGELAVQMLVAALRGEELPAKPATDVAAKSNGIGGTVITQPNAADFDAQWTG